MRDGSASEARPAATILMVRDGPETASDGTGGSLEVLMLRRNLKSAFVGGAYVFPGGAVDPEDDGAVMGSWCQGLDDETASLLLGIDRGGLAYWVAAIRECFEEAGVLLSQPGHRGEVDQSYQGSDGLLSFNQAGPRDRFVEHRAALNAGQRTLVDICQVEDVALAVGHVHYFAHWVTPLGAPRRYDTRFFVAAAPADQTPLHDAREVIDNAWLRPADALARHRQGDIDLILPTIKNLQAVSRFATCRDLLEAVRPDRWQIGRPPRLVPDGRGYRIALPGDPDPAPSENDTKRADHGPSLDVSPLDEADFGEASSWATRDPEGFREAVRRASRAANPDPGP